MSIHEITSLYYDTNDTNTYYDHSARKHEAKACYDDDGYGEFCDGADPEDYSARRLVRARSLA